MFILHPAQNSYNPDSSFSFQIIKYLVANKIMVAKLQITNQTHFTQHYLYFLYITEEIFFPMLLFLFGK